MTRPFTAATVLALICALSACKLEDTSPTADAGDTAAPQTDVDIMTQLVADRWEADVLPAVETNAVEISDLRTSLGNSLAAAGEQYGLRPDGEANSWNFIVTGTGTVTEANLESRAANMILDTDGDGAGDIELMLGPVIRGTSIRDAMPFFTFSDFRDQIEFAQLGRALNDRAQQGFERPESDPTGQDYSFTAVLTLKDAGSEWTGVPIELEPAQ